MEQFNKALSFILGLVVVAVFIVVASGKFSLKGINLAKSTKTISVTPSVTPNVTPKPTSKPWFSFLSKPTAKPTVRPTAKQTGTTQQYTFSNTSGNTGSNTGAVQPQKQVDPNYHSYSGSNVPTSIPNTGVPIVLFPLFGTSLLTGIFMKKIESRRQKTE